ncbi:polysaccharide deacetylase family protein [Candidatus Woesearchaeota archaeon]|nr:polysaccharide deacetylase family protein [Candidatus Woesearchaeota archaeon]
MKTKIKQFFGKLLFKKIIAYAFFYSGITYFFRTIYKNKNPLILMYHRIDKDQFDKQMQYLKKNYNVISLQELVSGLTQNSKFAGNTIAVTFDDGYLNNYENAFPIFKKYGLPATLFITTSLIGTKKFAWWDKIRHAVIKSGKSNLVFVFDNKLVHLDLSDRQEKIDAIALLHKLFSKYSSKKRNAAMGRLYNDLGVKEDYEELNNYMFMDWNQVIEMGENNIEIGSHTVSHPFLSNLQPKGMLRELKDSKKIIEKKLNRQIDSFCYPSGDMNARSEELVKKVGYNCACSIKTGSVTNKSDIYALERVGINIKDDILIFAMKCTKLWILITSKIRHDYHEA